MKLSEAEDLNFEIDEVLQKKKRRKLANKRVNKESILSPIMIKSQTSKLSNFSIPPLPKHLFKSLPGKCYEQLNNFVLFNFVNLHYKTIIF